MRTSLNEIEEIEKFLDGQLHTGETLVMEARLLTSITWRLHVFLHRKVRNLVQLYHRRKLKEDTARIHVKLFTDPSKKHYQNEIYTLFNIQKQ